MSRHSVRVGKLTALVAALNTELDATSAVAEARAFGVDPSTTATAAGFDLDAGFLASRTRLDAAYISVTQDDRWLNPNLVESIVDGYLDILALRAKLDGGTVTTADAARIRETLAADVTHATRAELRSLATHQARLPDGQLLARAVESATDSLELIAVGRQELQALSNYLLPAGRTDTTDPWSDLIISAALYDRAIGEMENSLPATLEPSWGRVTSTDAFVDYATVRDNALGGTQPGWDNNAGEFSAVVNTGANTVQAGHQRIEVMTEFDREIGDLMVAESRRLEDTASAGSRRALYSAISLALGTLAAAAITARSIARPLDRLVRRAQRISAGEFEPEIIAEARGPQDVVAVAKVLDELTTNLTTIDSQAAALAEGDLNAAVFDHVPTGSLGASIQNSVARVRDITATLDYQAHHDSLTGLANRAAVVDALSESMANGQVGMSTALSIFDLDGFKHANDTLGHLVGDELLRHAGDRLSASSEGGLVARLGGDEFVILTTMVQRDSHPIEVAERALGSLKKPFQTSAGLVWLTASAGLATMPAEAGVSSLELLRRADLALYQAKSLGPGSLAQYDDRLRALVDEQSEIEVGLRGAIANDDLSLHYQPIIDLATRRVGGFESLVRWRQPDGSMISPEVFVPIAERTDLIVHLDRWVINRACESLASMNSNGEGIGLSVNVSGRHLGTGRIVGVVEDALSLHRARPQDLLLEMTETGLIPNFDHAVDSLAALRERGVRVAIDDFGTGFASVAHLRKSNFDRLKIDRAFIANLDQPQERSIAQLLISLGRDLGLEVVAEGLETEEQVRWAHHMGCTHGQGYYLGRPAPSIPAVARVQ